MNIFHLRKQFFILLICLSLITAGLHLLNKKTQQEPLFLFSEIQVAGVNFQTEISDLVQKYTFLLNLRNKNQELERQIRELKARQQVFDEIRTENERLKKIIRFRPDPDFDFLPAQVTGTDFLSKNELLTINKGRRDGVKKFMGVVHPSGVVGYIFRVSPHSSQVISLLNPLSSLPARARTSRITGLISAGPKSLLSFDYLDRQLTEDQARKELKTGEAIVTIKSNQFPGGFLVGEILSIAHSSKRMEPELKIQPAVHFHSLEEVLLVRIRQNSQTELKTGTNGKNNYEK